jgi:tetratricopeptide (TPR) repeat protein
MKIGKIDVTVPMIAYFAGFVVALVVLLTMWSKNSDQRYEAICRGAIYRGMYDDGGDAINKAVESCQGIVDRNPGKVTARLYLANVQFRQKNYTAAQKSFEEAAGLSGATNREKGWAYTGAGVSVFTAAAKDKQAKAAVTAAEFFKKALAADKNCVDAMVNLGLVELYKGDPTSIDEAEKWCNTALELQAAGKSLVPSLKAQEQLYVLKAIVSAKRGKNSDAVANFDRVKAFRQQNTNSESNRRMAMLASVTEKGLDVAVRRELLTKLESDVSKYGKDSVAAYNALGIGNSLQESEPDFATVGMAAAIRHLTKAIDTDVKDLRGYHNLSVVLQRRMQAVAAKVSIPLTGLTGETPVNNRWLNAEKVTRYTPIEKGYINELKKLLENEEALWKKMQDKGKLEPADRIESKLRQLVCLRRWMYLLEPEEEAQRAAPIVRAINLQKDLEALAPDDPVVLQALGYFLLDKGDYLGAHKQFAKAAEKGAKSPELDRLIQGLGVKPEVGDIRPAPGKRFLGPRPLIGGTLKAISAGGVPKQAVMKIDDQPVQAVLSGPLGMQLLYYPNEKDLKDGEHSVTITMSDSLNQPVEFPSFTFALDKMPPKLGITPDLGTPLAGNTVFTVTLEDRTGVDFSTLKITMKSTKSKGKDELLISEGRVKRTMLETTPPRKIGFPIDSETFQFTAGKNLEPGEYEITIVVSDLAGNILTENKKFTVK